MHNLSLRGWSSGFGLSRPGSGIEGPEVGVSSSGRLWWPGRERRMWQFGRLNLSYAKNSFYGKGAKKMDILYLQGEAKVGLQFSYGK